MTLAGLLRLCDLRGVHLWLDGTRVRWAGPMTPALLAAARGHKADLVAYLTRSCSACGQTRPVMVLMSAEDTLWWLCAGCWRGATAYIGVSR